MTELELCMRDGFDGPTLANRLTVGIPMAIFTAIGLQLNIVLWRIITIQKECIEPTFRRHVVCLIAANVGFNLTAIHTLLPIAIFGANYPDWLLITLSTPDSFFYQAFKIIVYNSFGIIQVILYTNFTIALDRFLIFGAPRELLSGRKHYVLVFAPWFVATWIVGHSTIIGCYKRFNAYQLRFQYGCSNCEFFLDLNSYLSIVLPAVIFVLYFVIFVIIFRKRVRLANDMSLKNKDFTIVVQFLIITIILLAGNVLFYFNFSSDVIIESAIRLSASCWTTYSNPLVMFIFNERIRSSYLVWSKRLWIFEKDLVGNGGRMRMRSTTNVV